MARALILLGLLLVALGLVWHYAPGALAWFGRLPGDIRVRREGLSVFIPFTSGLLVSLALSLLLTLLGRLTGR